MRIESLYPYIVPLTFLAIWALTALFNRDAQPLPPRAARPPGPNGPNPPFGPGSARGPGARPEPPPRVAAPPRPRVPQQSPPRREPWNDPGIVILESEKRGRPSATTVKTPPPAERRAKKPLTQTSAGLHRVEPPPRGLSSALDGSASYAKGPAQRLSPLTLLASPLNAPSTLEGTSTELISPSTLDRKPLSGDEIRAILLTPQRLRESIVLSEILKPPLASRRGPFGKR